MGAYLDKPNTEKFSESGTSTLCAWGATGMQGWRTGMEDAHIASSIDLPKSNNKGMLFGVFDGHGGQEVAEHAKIHFQRILESQKEFKSGEYIPALTKAFMEYDALVKK
jgi:serine/threonine protein phosphatase PrpC